MVVCGIDVLVARGMFKLEVFVPAGADCVVRVNEVGRDGLTEGTCRVDCGDRVIVPSDKSGTDEPLSSLICVPGRVSVTSAIEDGAITGRDISSRIISSRTKAAPTTSSRARLISIRALKPFFPGIFFILYTR